MRVSTTICTAAGLTFIVLCGKCPACSCLTCSRAEATEEQTETHPESACRVKKPSISIVAGASTSEEVCPWEAAPEPRSRKNSAQLDSGSSSSDISVAIAEVSDRLRRTCGLTQQNTLDGDRRATRKLSTSSCMEPRRASVSVPISLAPDNKRSQSSFEDVPDSTALTVCVLPSGADNKTFKKSHSLTKSCSVTGANPPIISVSSVVDETVERLSEQDVVAEAGTQPPPLAPLAEPDSESPASELPPESSAQIEAKSNDVCPWEDE